MKGLLRLRFDLYIHSSLDPLTQTISFQLYSTLDGQECVWQVKTCLLSPPPLGNEHPFCSQQWSRADGLRPYPLVRFPNLTRAKPSAALMGPNTDLAGYSMIDITTTIGCCRALGVFGWCVLLLRRAHILDELQGIQWILQVDKCLGLTHNLNRRTNASFFRFMARVIVLPVIMDKSKQIKIALACQEVERK